MAGTSQARDGRMALSFILEKKDEPITGASGSLAIGEMGFIISKASSNAYTSTFLLFNNTDNAYSKLSILYCTSPRS